MAQVELTELSVMHVAALRKIKETTSIVASLDEAAKTVIFNGTLDAVIAAIQPIVDKIRERGGAKAQDYRSLVGVRNRLQDEKELATQGKSNTVTIIPNGANRGEVPAVLAGVPVVKDAGVPAVVPPQPRKRGRSARAAESEPATGSTGPTEAETASAVKAGDGADNPPVTADMRDKFRELARYADTPTGRAYWARLAEGLLPAVRPTVRS